MRLRSPSFLRVEPVTSLNLLNLRLLNPGDMVWRYRSVSRSTIVGVSRGQGMLLVLLDEDGTLALATPGDAGLVVYARASVLSARAWTAPTLGGTTL